MDLNQRPLAESLVEDPAQRTARRVAHACVIATRPCRQLVDHAFEGAA
jgi:hypothetical protein